MSIDLMTIDLDDSRERLRALMGGAVESHVHTALDEIVAAVERLRAEVVELRGEREAVVAWLQAASQRWAVDDPLNEAADAIERGEHRHEGAE